MIQGYLNGKTRDQIALDVGISGGKVSGIIKDWISEIGKPNVEDLRDFVVTVRKSGISVKECAEGYRMIQLLKNLNINGETDGYGSMGNNDRDANKEIILFIEEIYLNCKRSDISPSIIISWIRDLLDFFDHSHNINNHCNSLTCTNNEDDQDNHMEDGEHRHQQHQQWPNTNKPNIQNSPMRTGIPFISKVSQYITQRKKECRMLVENIQYLIKEKDELILKKDKAEQNLRQLYQKEKFVLSHIDLFSKLKKELYDGHGIKIEEDIQGFAKMINDFKNHNFDTSKILNEYLTSLSLKLTIKANESKVENLEVQIASMQSSFSYWRTQSQIHKQAMDIYNELQAMGFGLEELKRIWYVIVEISTHKNIPMVEAVSLFIKDVEEHYYDDLLFKDTANSRRDELKSQNIQISQNRFTLQATPLVGPALTNLFQNGVSEQDIIEINKLVHDFKNNIIPLDDYSEGKDTKHDKENKPNEKWSCRSLIDELKKYGGIKLAIKEHSKKLDRIKQEVNDSNKQK